MSEKWITQREAAELLGVHQSAVPKMIRRGDLSPRARQRPQLLFDQVVTLAQARAEAIEDRDRRRAEVGRGPRPPDAEHEWLLIEPAAAVLGCSVGALGNRVNRGQVPVTRHDGRRWFRLDLLELLLRAQHARRTMGG